MTSGPLQIAPLSVHGEVTLSFSLRAERAEEVLAKSAQSLKRPPRGPKAQNRAKTAADSRPLRPKTAYGVARSAPAAKTFSNLKRPSNPRGTVWFCGKACFRPGGARRAVWKFYARERFGLSGGMF